MQCMGNVTNFDTKSRQIIKIHPISNLQSSQHKLIARDLWSLVTETPNDMVYSSGLQPSALHGGKQCCFDFVIIPDFFLTYDLKLYDPVKCTNALQNIEQLRQNYSKQKKSSTCTMIWHLPPWWRLKPYLRFLRICCMRLNNI